MAAIWEGAVCFSLAQLGHNFTQMSAIW